MLWASIIRKCNKIRQTDYISELGSKIKTQFGEGFNYGVCACLPEYQPLNRFAAQMLMHKFVVNVYFCMYKAGVHLSCLVGAICKFVFMFAAFCVGGRKVAVADGEEEASL